jgi:NAD-reducing hydrogenase small subunit
VWPVEALLKNAYIDRATYAPGLPDEPGIIPRLTARVAPLHHVVSVDEYIPGCPPDAERIWQALLALLGGGHVRSDEAPAAKFG